MHWETAMSSWATTPQFRYMTAVPECISQVHDDLRAVCVARKIVFPKRATDMPRREVYRTLPLQIKIFLLLA